MVGSRLHLSDPFQNHGLDELGVEVAGRLFEPPFDLRPLGLELAVEIGRLIPLTCPGSKAGQVHQGYENAFLERKAGYSKLTRADLRSPVAMHSAAMGV